MKTVARCELCNNEIEVDDSQDGLEVGCPWCGMNTVVRVKKPAPPLPKIDAQPSNRPPPVAPKRNISHCLDCDGIVSVNAYACPHCGGMMANRRASMPVASTLVCFFIGGCLWLNATSLEEVSAIHQIYTQLMYLTGAVFIGIALLLCGIYEAGKGVALIRRRE